MTAVTFAVRGSSTMDWYIREESGDAGPFSTNDVIARYNDGTLLPTSRVRASDSSMWQE